MIGLYFGIVSLTALTIFVYEPEIKHFLNKLFKRRKRND